MLTGLYPGIGRKARLTLESIKAFLTGNESFPMQMIFVEIAVTVVQVTSTKCLS